MKYSFKSLLFICVIVLMACNNPQVSRFTEQEVIEDLEYMITHIHAYFPFVGVLYRDRGIDIDQLGIRAYNDIRRYFARRRYWDSDSLLYFFRVNFGVPLQPLGHFSIQNYALDDTYLVYSRESSVGVSTQIIEEDRIAMMRIPSFLHNTRIAQTGLLDDISHYNHLIIDIRGNRGGFPSTFIRSLILPLLKEDMYLEMLGFVTTMEHAHHRPHVWYGSFYWSLDPTQTIHFTPIDEFLEQISLDPVTIHDIDLFGYGAKAVYHFTARRSRNPETNQMEITPAFSGKVWLVIDDQNFSGATYFARFMRDLNLATLVGRTQGGANGGDRMNFQLPNTGFWIHYDAINLSDRYGRSWEEYRIEPHIFHHDPINHILYLIETGNY